MPGLELKYFILKPKSKFVHDPYAMASRAAMKEYAKYIRKENPDLCHDLNNWATEELRKEMDMSIGK